MFVRGESIAKIDAPAKFYLSEPMPFIRDAETYRDQVIAYYTVLARFEQYTIRKGCLPTLHPRLKSRVGGLNLPLRRYFHPSRQVHACDLCVGAGLAYIGRG